MSRVEQEIIAEIQNGLVAWYPFHEKSMMLQISEAENSTTVYLREGGHHVDCVSANDLLQKNTSKRKYDYIIVVAELERTTQPEKLLAMCRAFLKEKGTLLLAVDNRLGIRYFCGDRDPFTDRSFDGIENYRRADSSDGARVGRCYSRAQVEEFLTKVGFMSHHFYSVMPDIRYPQMVFAEEYLPREELGIRIFPMYHTPDTVFLEEQYLYTDLIDNGLFHPMANGYLIECTLPEQFTNINQVTMSLERDKNDAFLTIISRDNKVEKRALYQEGELRLQQLICNHEALAARGIAVVDAKIEGNSYTMPFVDAPLVSTYLRELIHRDTDMFVREMDRFKDMILQSSEIVSWDEEDGAILAKGYFDMVPLNSFYVDGNYVLFDQEFVIENYPANVIITRLVDLVYQGDLSMQYILPREFFYERYGVKAQIKKWYRMINEFLKVLRNETELRVHHEKHRRNMSIIHTNRQRMNYSEVEYEQLFVNIFDKLDKKKLILFGTGVFAKKFVAMYGKEYSIYAIVDNNETKWGTEFEGITIQSPEIFKELESGEYKVIVCIKNYLAVLKQLKQIGVKHIGIYDTAKEYRSNTARLVSMPIEKVTVKKKYGVGYIAGVFDLFHVGHLNMFKRAKEQCEYLIVGVVTDEGVRRNKKVEPFIPFEERLEIVQACEYVDKAVEIPLDYAGTRDAYRLHHFDVQFSGSDYVDNPNWLAEKEFLEKNGAELVFFPYTEQTSSTKIKALINERL